MTLATLQRLTLELIGLLEYCETYKPIIQGVSLNKGLVKHLICAFFININDTEVLFRAGIPYWFVHPLRNLSCIRVDERVAVSTPSLESYDLSMRGSLIIYEGPADIFAQHGAVMRNSVGLGLGCNVFKESSSHPPTASADFRPTQLTHTKRKKKSHMPCKLLSKWLSFH